MAIRTGSATSNGSFSSLSISGTTSKSGNMSWSIPTLPDGATITGTTLTATLTASMTRGTPTVTINNMTYNASSSLSYNLGTTTKTSLSVTARGSNKNARGTISISNIVYTVNYQYDDGTTATYTVHFLDWDGSVLKTETVEEGNNATPPSNPSRTGYDFIGWQGSYTNITANTDITAQYKIKTFTVRFLDWDNSVIDTQTINYGSNATPPSNPTRQGYKFTGWQGSYTNITADTDIIATYEVATQYTIVSSSSEGGTISPSGTTTVYEGNSVTYTITPNENYVISSVLVDNVEQGAINTYTFNNITSNHTISVVFAKSLSRQAILTPVSVDLTASEYLDESSPFTNAIGKGSDNEGDYAEWGLVTGSQANTRVYWSFDMSSIPSNATITNVTCSARCSNTNENILQGGNTLIAIGTITNGNEWTNKVASDNASFGTTATVVTVSDATFTREELNNFRLKIQAVRGFLSTSTSYHTKFYGATLTIDYTVPSEETSTTRNIYIGNTKISNIYLGNSKIVKVYLGNTLLFE